MDISATNAFIVTNTGILPQSELNILRFKSEHSIYEVIRIIDGVALFLEEHFDRLVSSAQMYGFHFSMEFSVFRHNITELVRLNQVKNCNVKFALSEKQNKIQWLFSIISHSYPDSNDYQQGVATDLIYAERENPNVKIIQNSIRERASQMTADQKLFEALLVDRNGMITEGSRSNVFFVKDNIFYTAPASAVLIGITRQKVIECITELGFKVAVQAISVTDIGSYDAVFLTGTSPKVLPIRSIGQFEFNAQLLVVKELIDCYNRMIDRYIKTH